MRSESVFRTITSLYHHAMSVGITPRTLSIEGPPGGGKTSVGRAAAKKLDVHYIEKHMPTMLVEDFGIPVLNADKTQFHYAMPDWYPGVGSKYDDGRGGILMFDDRNQANAELQKVLANICQARNLHGVPMADKWMVISTGNRQSDKAGANKVLSHLRNRETVVSFETNVDDWMGWAIDNGVNPEVLSFIRFRPELLHDFKPQNDVNPTPRSWVEGVSDVLGAIPHEAELDAFSGAVGPGAATEFMGFLRTYRSLPDPDKVLADPANAAVPTDPVVLYALTGALANRVTKDTFGKLTEFGMRLPAEFSVLMISTAVRRDSSFTATKGFATWNNKFQRMLW